jgi:hypothetical protein
MQSSHIIHHTWRCLFPTAQVWQHQRLSYRCQFWWPAWLTKQLHDAKSSNVSHSITPERSLSHTQELATFDDVQISFFMGGIWHFSSGAHRHTGSKIIWYSYFYTECGKLACRTLYFQNKENKLNVDSKETGWEGSDSTHPDEVLEEDSCECGNKPPGFT